MNPALLILFLLPEILKLIPQAKKMFKGKSKGIEKKKFVTNSLMKFYDMGATTGALPAKFAAVPKESVKEVIGTLIDSGVRIFNLFGKNSS